MTHVTSDEIEVSILIVTWNSGPWIEECLASISSGGEDASLEILLHDNGSSDDTLERVRQAGGDFAVTGGDENRGFAGGINEMLARARGKFVLLMNPDCVVERGSIGRLAGFLAKNPDLAGVVPLLIDEDGEPQRDFQFRRLPTLASLATELLMFDEIAPDNPIVRRHRCRDLDLSEPVVIEQPAAAAMMIRRSVLVDRGGMDERFHPAWFEDVDLCRRLRDSGERLVLVPEARFVHAGGSSLSVLGLGAFQSIWYRNLMKYITKWSGPGEREIVRLMVIAGILLRMLGTVIFGVEWADRSTALRVWAGVLGETFDR